MRRTYGYSVFVSQHPSTAGWFTCEGELYSPATSGTLCRVLAGRIKEPAFVVLYDEDNPSTHRLLKLAPPPSVPTIVPLLGESK